MTRLISEGQVLRGEGYDVRVGERGRLRVEVGGEGYDIETHLSYPGATLGWNDLGERGPGCEPAWQPHLAREARNAVAVRAAGAHYSLSRRVSVARHRVIVTDTLTNTGYEEVGVIYRNELTSPQPFRQCLLGGVDRSGAHLTAENPSVYVAQARSRLAWLAEDTLLRLQLALSSSANRVRMAAERLSLQPGQSYTFRWALYPLPAEADYWRFINQVRRDWEVNFRLIGPWVILDVTARMDLIRDHEALAKYLARNRAQVVAIQPWVDYENYNSWTGRPTSRAELKPLLQEAMAAVKRVNPAIMCIGCIECNLVGLPQDVTDAIYATVRDQPQGLYPFTPQQMEILTQHDLRWKDCLLQSRDGRYRYEVYYRGSHFPMMAISVFAAPGNDQHKYWLDQARFLLEDVGLDGLYIDQFSLAFNDEQRYSYHAWDGTTVDIAPATGRIAARYTDGALVSIGAQESLVEYVLSKGRYMVANTFPASPEMQSLRVHRFNESEWNIDPLGWRAGTEPPLASYPCAGHLSTPIALGFRPGRLGEKGRQDYARLIMKAAIIYLRHGLLYYHYPTEIPQSGPGAGEYGAINHMFPITPVELHPGWIVGKERIVTCVSGEYRWANRRKPKVLVFDLNGRAVTPQATLQRDGSRWVVKLQLRDWQEMAVLE
ncbi:MAG TPA: hypothetical protein VM221_00025 [Armatimonadota bacterium]|nr:hypothetical protein [Armatimonadota bacterium]